MIHLLDRLLGMREKNPDRLQEKDIVTLVQNAYTEEFKRLRIESPETKLSRIGHENILFTEIPSEVNANAVFMHRNYYYGPKWKEIHVEKKLIPTEKIFSLSHDALHALSANDDGTGGMRAFDWTLQQWGYSGLDEAITDHFARHVIETQIVPCMPKRFSEAYTNRNQSHSYSYLVMYLERVMRRIALETKKANETDGISYIRIRDFIYKEFISGNRDAVATLLHKYVAPGTGTLFAAVTSPMGKEGTPGSISHQEARSSLDSAEKIAASFIPQTSEGLVKTIYKPYLDLKNYPGYPDRVNEKFVANVISDHHLYSLIGRFGETIVTDPVEFEFTNDSITAIYQQIGAIDEDLDIIKRNNLFSEQSNLSKLYELHTTLTMIASYISLNHRAIWNAIRQSAQAGLDTPNLEALRARGHKAVLVSREYNKFWTENVYTYLFNKVKGDVSARLKI